MVPNKLEKDIKEKLEQRSIQPSPMAWDRLDAMLAVTEEKNKKPKSRTWLFIAAGFLGFLLVVTLFLKQSDNKEVLHSEPAVVEISKETNTANEIEQPELPLQKTQSNPVVLPTQKKPKQQVAHVKQERLNRRVKVNTLPEVVKQKEDDLYIQEISEVADNSKPQDVIKNTEEQANILLADSFDKSLKKRSSVKVDPNSLLSGVEGELNESFRGKVWQTVTKNYTAIKTTVANRNKE